jgi:hypothetical protein
MKNLLELLFPAQLILSLISEPNHMHEEDSIYTLKL